MLTARLRGLGTVLLDVSVSHSLRTALARELLRSNCHAKRSKPQVGTQPATEQLPCQTTLGTQPATCELARQLLGIRWHKPCSRVRVGTAIAGKVLARIVLAHLCNLRYASIVARGMLRVSQTTLAITPWPGLREHEAYQA